MLLTGRRHPDEVVLKESSHGVSKSDPLLRFQQLLNSLLRCPGLFSLCVLGFTRGCLSRPAARVVLGAKPIVRVLRDFVPPVETKDVCRSESPTCGALIIIL